MTADDRARAAALVGWLRNRVLSGVVQGGAVLDWKAVETHAARTIESAVANATRRVLRQSDRKAGK